MHDGCLNFVNNSQQVRDVWITATHSVASVAVEIGAAAVAYFITGKCCGGHLQALNQTTAICWWRAELEASSCGGEANTIMEATS